MRRKAIFYLLGTVFALFFSALKAQEQPASRDKAEKLYEEFQYAKAAELYVKLTDVPKPRLEDMERLADCYWKMNKYEDAEIWYARVVQDPKCDSQDLFFYGEVLKSNAKYPEAKEVLEQYLQNCKDRNRVAVSIEGCDSASVWVANPTGHAVVNEQAINSERSEFSVFPMSDRMVFFVGEPENNGKQKKYGWTGNSFLRIYIAERFIDNTLHSRVLSNMLYNTEKYHVGPISTNKEGNIHFITRTFPGKRGHLSKVNNNTFRTQNMELYFQSKMYGQWQTPKPFDYNNVKKYSLGQAVLSKDERVLYFVSDMPGGKGGTDIWFSELLPDGTWSKCYNAGSVVNTPGDEMFPSVGLDGTFYFSSNGHPGMGGLDVFSCKGSRYKWDKPANMRYPVNSPGDDFSYVLNGDQRSGYLSSNRANGMGGDDIYSFVYEKSKMPFVIEGTVYNKKTRQVLPDAEVSLYSTNKNLIARRKSGENGAFIFKLDKKDFFDLKGTKVGFYPDTASTWSSELYALDRRKVALYLDPLEVGKTFRLENILYDFDKDNIRKDAALILDGLVSVMHENPTLKIELASHTDCRGTDIYNQDLSQRRAQSAVNYLVSRGISRDRMVAKGYGESRLINRCADGVKCSEAEHQQNRRTEFTVMSY